MTVNVSHVSCTCRSISWDWNGLDRVGESKPGWGRIDTIVGVVVAAINGLNYPMKIIGYYGSQSQVPLFLLKPLPTCFFSLLLF